MASFFVQLADAVVSLLNAGKFSREFQAQRVYDPLNTNLGDFENFRVDVVLGDRKQEPLDRSRQKNSPRIEIIFRQLIKRAKGSDEEKADLDALVEFVESVDSWISLPANRRPPAASFAGWQGSELVYPFVPAQLRDSRLFISLLRLTYFVATT